ncbi:hypothetical protein ES705_03969 [subsurface metagenome]
MARTKEIEFADVLGKLPNISSLDCEKDLAGEEYNIFMCALGFEERCLTIPERLAEGGNFKCKQSIYFEYATNIETNAVNRPRLLRAFQKFSDSYISFPCDGEDFTKRLRELLKRIVPSKHKLKIALDISSCSSKLLLLTIKVLFEFDINLRIIYSEAAVYHPTCEEFEKESEKWTTEEGFGVARGVGKVIPSPEHPGNRRDKLPELIIVFPTFKPERTNAIITDIDESLLIKPSRSIIWIIGDPHMDEKTKRKRKDMIRMINKIPLDSPSYEISTFDYKKTVEILEQIYKSKETEFHINISALGSKMQSLGIGLFWYVRQDSSIYFAVPKEYNPSQYSEGCKATWQINYGDLTDIRAILDNVGQIKII